MSSLVSYFLRRDLESCCPHINLLVHVNAGDDKEDPRAPRSSSHEATEPEDDGPLVLLHSCDERCNFISGRSRQAPHWTEVYLDHLDGVEEREWKGGEDYQDGAQGEQQGADPRRLLAVWTSCSQSSVDISALTCPLGLLAGAAL